MKKDDIRKAPVLTAGKRRYEKPQMLALSCRDTTGGKFMIAMSEGSVMIGMGTFSFGPS